MGVIRYLSWSYSRGETWKSCRRAFFYEFGFDGEEDLKKAPLLARLKSPAMIAGIVVDELVTSALQGLSTGCEVPSDLGRRGVETFATLIANSPSNAALIRRGHRPEEGQYALQAEYYDSSSPEGEVQRSFVVIQDALEGFVRSPLLKKLARCNEEAFRFAPARTPSYRIGAIKVFAKYDFMVVHGSRLLLIDWKTSSKSESSEFQGRKQLAIYAKYAISKKIASLENTSIQPVFLREAPEWAPEPISESLIELVEDEIHTQTEELMKLVGSGYDADGHPAWIANREAFEANAHPRKCGACRFRELCPEGRDSLLKG